MLHNKSNANNRPFEYVPCNSNKLLEIGMTIIRAATTGSWVLLDNVHLCLEILPAV